MQDTSRQSTLPSIVTLRSLILISLPAVFLALILSDVRAQQPFLDSLPFIELSVPDVADVTWNPAGTRLAVAAGNDVWIYTDTFEELAQFQGHTDAVLAIDWSPDGTHLASAGNDGTVRVWDTIEGSNFGNTTAIYQGNTLAVTYIRWNPVSGDPRLAISKLDQEIQVSDPDENQGIGYFTYKVEILDTVSNEVMLTSQTGYANIWSLDWNPDGTQLATTGSGFSRIAYTVTLWDTTTGQFLAALETFAEFEINDISWRPDGSSIAVGSELQEVLVEDAATQNTLVQLRGYESPVTEIDWSSDNDLLASGGNNGTITIWDVPTAQRLAFLSGHSGTVRALEWSVSGNKLATASSVDDKVRIWDTSNLPDVSGTPTVTPLPTLTPTTGPTPTPTATPLPNALDEIAFTRLVSDAGGDREQIFTMNLDGSGLANFSNNLFSEYDPVWSPDGTRIAFTSTRSSGTPHIFVRDLSDPDPNNALQVTSGTSANYDPAWSPDGQKIAFTSERDGNQEIYATQADGSTINTPTQVTNNPAYDFDPDWSIENNITLIASWGSCRKETQ